MQKIASLLNSLTRDYPDFQFAASDTHKWSMVSRCVHYDNDHPQPELILHELGHAILSHDHYDRDIQLVAMERQAWDEARKIAGRYHVTLSDETIQDALDSYREWMHQRSLCPCCNSTGLESNKRVYVCPTCGATWRVNDARACGLRRYTM